MGMDWTYRLNLGNICEEEKKDCCFKIWKIIDIEKHIWVKRKKEVEEFVV